MDSKELHPASQIRWNDIRHKAWVDSIFNSNPHEALLKEYARTEMLSVSLVLFDEYPSDFAKTYNSENMHVCFGNCLLHYQ